MFFDLGKKILIFNFFILFEKYKLYNLKFYINLNLNNQITEIIISCKLIIIMGNNYYYKNNIYSNKSDYYYYGYNNYSSSPIIL